MYDKCLRNWEHYTNIHVQWNKLHTVKNLKLQFKMLQNISLIVIIKKATKCVDVGVIYIVLLNWLWIPAFKFISQTIIKLLWNSYILYN